MWNDWRRDFCRNKLCHAVFKGSVRGLVEPVNIVRKLPQEVVNKASRFHRYAFSNMSRMPKLQMSHISIWGDQGPKNRQG